MKFPIRPTLLGLVFSLTFPLACSAAGQPVPAETMVARLDEAVPLTSEQKIRITTLLQKQNDAIRSLPTAKAADPQSEMSLIEKTFEIRAATRSGIRALLTPEQQKKYDHIPQTRGGGQTQDSSARVAQLDAQVGLTSEQKKLAAQIYDEEYEELLAFPPEDRPRLGQEARQSSKALIQAMLTPEQRQKLDTLRSAERQHNADERKELQTLLKNSAAVTARVGSIKSFESTTSFVSDNGKNRSGKATCKATGTQRTEMLTVYWEKSPASAAMKIVKLEGPTGEQIQP